MELQELSNISNILVQKNTKKYPLSETPEKNLYYLLTAVLENCDMHDVPFENSIDQYIDYADGALDLKLSKEKAQFIVQVYNTNNSGTEFFFGGSCQELLEDIEI